MKDLTRLAVTRQIAGMACNRYQIGLRDETPARFQQHKWDVPQLFKALPWLKHRNATGAHIYIRPVIPGNLVLLDDLSHSALDRMTREGLTPAVVVETSPHNFQAWLRLSDKGSLLSPRAMTYLIRKLANRFHADPNCVDWGHYGRLGGFTNRKLVYRNAQGIFPYVLVRKWHGQVAEAGAFWLEEAARSAAVPIEEVAAEQHRATPDLPNDRQRRTRPGMYGELLKQICNRGHNRSWRQKPDWSRLDYMICREMHGLGYSRKQMTQVLAEESPNLQARKAGHAADYINRTISKAQEQGAT